MNRKQTTARKEEDAVEEQTRAKAAEQRKNPYLRGLLVSLAITVVIAVSAFIIDGGSMAPFIMMIASGFGVNTLVSFFEWLEFRTCGRIRSKEEAERTGKH